MGGSLSTIRWTPYGPLPGGGAGDRHPQGSRANPLRKSKSFPPNQHGDPGRGSSPSNSTSNLSGSYDNDGVEHNEEDFLNAETRGGDHLGTSGILMGVNAPPLYDACLVGRWDEVLDLCGVEREHVEEEHRSHDSPNTGTTLCSSTDEDPGFPSGDERGREITTTDGIIDGGDNASTSSMGSQRPFLQTRYADRRRNTPLHLACRRQPPPSVVRALLNHSPCEAVSRRTADGLTPLHFAAYCGAGVEVVSMLVDRMRSDAAVGRATRLSLDELDENRESGGGKNHNRSADGRWVLPSEESALRVLDRRRRTPLHCALSGFRTPIRPLVVRKLLAVDPASATLGDERGRTPLSLLFDDYAEEVMEALEEDVSPEMARERTQKGGELYECWRMLRVLLQAAYRGSVSEDDDEGEGKSLTSSLTSSQQGFPVIREGGDASDKVPNKTTPTPQNTPQPQDRRDHLKQKQQSSVREVNVVEMYERERFSMVHAAAGVWECPAPMAKLVLKCLCGSERGEKGKRKAESSEDGWDHRRGMDLSGREGVEDVVGLIGGPEEGEKEEEEEEKEDVDPTQQPDEESMRLPLHIAVCARPQGREGYSARLRVWLSSTPEMANSLQPRRTNSRSSMSSSMRSGTSLAGSGERGRSSMGKAAGQVYNPRFGRSPSRDSVAAYQSSQSMRRSRQAVEDRRGGAVPSAPDRGYISRSGSNASITANIAREPFLQHTMVRDVLALHPAAAAVVDNRTGKLPIVLAIEHGKSWETAVGPLLDAHPHPFGGGGDGGMALPDDGPEVMRHREDLQAALFVALSSPEVHVRDEAIRTAGKLAGWGGVYGMPGSLDGIVGEWLDTMAKHSNAIATEAAATMAPPSPEGIVVGPGASSLDPFQTQSSHLTAVAEVISHSRPESVSDRIARLCLCASREYLFSKNGGVREAAARVLGNTLNFVGDADDAANVMREVVLGNASDDGSVVTVSSKSVFGGRENEEDVIAKHGRLLACNSILSTQWGAELVATPDICDAIVTFIHGCVKDRNNAVVRSAAYHAMGPLLGKSGTAAAHHPNALSRRTATSTLREMRSNILKGTRASERPDVQLALARGLTAASRMHPDLFLCRGGMPVMDAALMLAMSSSVKRPQVQKAFQIFLWVALQMGGGEGRSDGSEDSGMDAGIEGRGNGSMNSPGLDKYIELAEGENGRIMMKFVTQTLAKIEDLDDL